MKEEPKKTTNIAGLKYDNFIFSTITDEFGEYSTSLLKLFLKVEGNDQSAVLNMLSNYLKLSVRSQGKIDGQIEELLKTEWRRLMP